MSKSRYDKNAEDKIIKLYKSGYSGRYIIETLKLPKKQVYDVIRNVDRNYVRVKRKILKVNDRGEYKIHLPQSFIGAILDINSNSKNIWLTLDKKNKKLFIEPEKNKYWNGKISFDLTIKDIFFVKKLDKGYCLCYHNKRT